MFTDGEIAILCFVVILACYGYPLHKNNSKSFYILLAKDWSIWKNYKLFVEEVGPKR